MIEGMVLYSTRALPVALDVEGHLCKVWERHPERAVVLIQRSDQALDLGVRIPLLGAV